ncbi:MAG: flagellar export protein FliJ [Clostridia bacterium]|nr:flagellar export protein FliJ [Clostridia bacterium]
MPKFVFKLQPLLNIKTQMEDSLKNELGKATQKLEDEKRVLKGIELEQETIINEINIKSTHGVLVEKLKEYSTYISFLKDKANLQKENINLAQNNVDKYREQLIKVVQEKKILEKLKEKQYQEFLKDQMKEEQKLNDEIVSYKYTDKLTGDGNG